MKDGTFGKKTRSAGVFEHPAPRGKLLLRQADGVHGRGELCRQQPAPRDYQLIARGVEQGQMQPKFVLVGMECGFER